MTENKRYVQFEFPYDEFAVKDNKTNEELWNPKVVDRLNEQEEEIQELKQRNKRQYNQLKEITDLMTKRDWKTLENMVEEWKKQEKLLQAEWGTYCGDKE